ncbi:hypothetical protein BDK51DRAFT_31475, partial [Blyttiomyces helicus]
MSSAPSRRSSLISALLGTSPPSSHASTSFPGRSYSRSHRPTPIASSPPSRESSPPPPLPPTPLLNSPTSPPAPDMDRSPSSCPIRIQLFPHADPNALTATLSRYDGFTFAPVEKDVYPNTIVRIGRKVDRSKDKPGVRRGDKFNNVAEAPEEMDGSAAGRGEDKVAGKNATASRKIEYVAFRSKVVSRTHAELWIDKEGQ